MTKTISARVTLNKNLRELLNGGFPEKRVLEKDLAKAAAMAHYFILSRTARGEFLNRDAKTTYSSAYRTRRFRAKGYTNEQVTLSFTGAMLDALQSTVVYRKGNPTALIGYPENDTEPDVLDLAAFHNTLGAGKSRVVREFIGLTPAEEKQVISFLKKKIR